jgi:hypothetical protein
MLSDALESVTLIVTVLVPVSVTAPEITPSGLMESPAGSPLAVYVGPVVAGVAGALGAAVAIEVLIVNPLPVDGAIALS